MGLCLCGGGWDLVRVTERTRGCSVLLWLREPGLVRAASSVDLLEGLRAGVSERRFWHLLPVSVLPPLLLWFFVFSFNFCAVFEV